MLLTEKYLIPMNTSDFNEYDFNFANDHLRILSAFYPLATFIYVISPIILIEPYFRLENES